MPVGEFLTPSLGLSAPRFGNHLSSALSLSLTVAEVGECADKGRMGGWEEKVKDQLINGWMDLCIGRQVEKRRDGW